MNLRVIAIVLSLLTNAVLAAWVVWPASRWARLFSPSEAQLRSGATAAAPSAPVPDVIPSNTWSGVSSGDLAAVAARLRAEGFPTDVQRAILSALVQQQFSARHRELAEMIKAQPWWLPYTASAKIISARQQLRRDEKEAVNAALGTTEEVTPYKHAQLVRKYGDLPTPKLVELDRLDTDYDELIGDVRTNAQGILLPEDREKIAFLEKEKRADLTRALAADELFEYDARSGPSAKTLRRELVAFNPTEEEFRALLRVQQSFDAKYGASPELTTTTQRVERVNARKELLEQAKGVLPPERFAEYQEKTDATYLQAHAFVTRMELPPATAGEIVAVQKDISTRAGAVRRDTALTPEQRTAQLKSLASEAVLRLSNTLGTSGLAAYRQAGGYWLNALENTPPPPPTRASPKP